MRKLLAGMAVIVLMAGTAVWGGDANKDREKLQGTWMLTQTEFKGEKKAAPKGMTLQLVFQGNKVIAKGGPKGDEEGTFTLDASKKPKQITLTKKGGGADDTLMGIYALEGDTLKIGHSLKGPKAPPPTSFKGDDVLIMTLKKKK